MNVSQVRFHASMFFVTIRTIPSSICMPILYRYRFTILLRHADLPPLQFDEAWIFELGSLVSRRQRGLQVDPSLTNGLPSLGVRLSLLQSERRQELWIFLYKSPSFFPVVVNAFFQTRCNMDNQEREDQLLAELGAVFGPYGLLVAARVLLRFLDRVENLSRPLEPLVARSTGNLLCL